jgi:hypothetical protein
MEFPVNRYGRRRGAPPVSLAACLAALAAVYATDPSRAARSEAILKEWLSAQYKEEFMALLEDEEFTFEAEIFTRRVKAAEEQAAQAVARQPRPPPRCATGVSRCCQSWMPAGSRSLRRCVRRSWPAAIKQVAEMLKHPGDPSLDCSGPPRSGY